MRILTCQCGLPFARIEGACLVVETKHRGETHTCSISLTDLWVQSYIEMAQTVEEFGEQLRRIQAQTGIGAE